MRARRRKPTDLLLLFQVRSRYPLSSAVRSDRTSHVIAQWMSGAQLDRKPLGRVLT